MIIFRTRKLDYLLKGETMSTGNGIEFNSNLYQIIIVIQDIETRFTIRNQERQYYVYDRNRNDRNELGILAEFLKFFEKNCSKSEIKLKLSEEMRIEREKL